MRSIGKNSIRWTVLALSLAVLVAGGGILAVRLRAQQPAVQVPAHPSPYYVINFVDSVPNFREAAVATLKQYVADDHPSQEQLNACGNSGLPDNHAV